MDMDLSDSLQQLNLCNELLYLTPTHDPVFRDIQLKRAQRFLMFHLYSKSLQTSESILLKEPFEFRAMDLKIRAQFGLGHYQGSITYICRVQKQLKANLMVSVSGGTECPQTIHRLEKQSRKLGNFLKDARNLLEQSKWGFYDMSLFVPNRKIKFDTIAEYEGPIQITNIERKGRGVIATRDIHPGELLMVSRAFEIVFDEGDEDALEMAIAQKLRLDPTLIPSVYSLFAGQELGHINSNSNDLKELEVDLKRITGICTMNAFGNSRNTTGYGHDSRGLWISPSYFNHDCIDFNSMWKVLGDFIFIRAYKPVKKGQELLISYTDSAETLEERRKFFLVHDFICNCRLCEYQGNKESLQMRERKTEILKMIESIDTGAKDKELLQSNAKIVEDALQELEAMSQGVERPEWNFSTHVALDALCKLYLKLDDKRYLDVAKGYYYVVNGIKEGDEGNHLENGGRQGICMEIGAAGQVASVFLKAGDLQGTQHWIDVLKKDLRLIYGVSDVFKFIYPVLCEQAKKNGIKL